MKIRITDAQKINNVLNEEQKGCTARTQSFASINAVAVEAELILDKLFIPKSKRIGVIVCYCEYISSNAYAKKAYKAGTTSITLLRGKDSWFLIRAERDEIYATETGKNYAIFLKPEQKEIACNNFLKNNYVV
jgi:hypothetical protein